MKYKKIIAILFLVVFLLSFVSSDEWGVWVRPLSGGSTQPSTSFSYYYIFSSGSTCAPVLYQTETQNIQTDTSGVGFLTFTLPTNLTNTQYICEYKNGSLRTALPVAVQFVNNSFVQNLSSQGNISTNSWFLGNLNYSYLQNIPSFITWDNAVNGTLLNYSDALNGSIEIKWNANATNFTAIYGYALNDSLWTANYSNFSVIYGYALNGTGWVANYSNYLITNAYALNDSLWALNYTDYLAIRTYATNSSLWTSNYSNFSILYGNQLGNASNRTTMYANIYNNYTNFSNIYTNVTLYNGTEIRWNANFSNFTTIYGNQLGNASNFTTAYSNLYNNYTNFSRVYAMEYNGTLVQNGTTNRYNLSLAQLKVGSTSVAAPTPGVNITTNLTLFKEDNGTGYFRLAGNVTSSALVSCASGVQGTLAVNTTGLYYCNSTVNGQWVKLA